MSYDVIKFMGKFLEAEYQVYLANFTEPDNAVFHSKIEKYMKFFAFEIDSGEVGIFRPASVDDAWFSEQQEQAEAIAPRKLFLVRTYQNPDYGTIHRCYVSDEFKENLDYSATFCVGEFENEAKIISRYLINWKHAGWDWTGGKKIQKYGQLVSVQRLQAPEDSNDLSDYQSDKGSI